MSAATENRDVARTAIEQVCARGDMELAPSCYAEGFADYFASSEHHGLEGVRKSTDLYRQLFDDLRFEVVDQVADGRPRSKPLGAHRNQSRPRREPAS
jgi:hypothetical protein